MRKKERERILILCSHADDEIISMGGTIAKYVKERKDIRIVIFTSGEKSMPWMKEGVITKKRVKESEAAGKLLGCKVEFLGLPDLKIKENLEGNAKKIKKSSRNSSRIKFSRILDMMLIQIIELSFILLRER